MSVGFKSGEVLEEIGEWELLHAFFSSICHHLERGDWGSKYPELMNELFQGTLKHEAASRVLNSVIEIKNKFEKIAPNEIIWDIYDLSKVPPWGEDISSDIKNLSQYFVTNSGKAMFEVLIKCLRISAEQKKDLQIIQM